MRARLPDRDGLVTRDGVNLAYEIYGDAPDTMLFIPPWSIVHSRIYKAQLPYFSERFRCITYDGRGNGKSDRPGDVAAYSLDNYLADALAVMDALDVERAILVGLSFGGLLASILAAHHPERVRAAILAGTITTIGPPHYARFDASHFTAKRDSYEGWDKFNRDYWLKNYPDFAEFFIRNIFNEPHSTKQIEDGVGWAVETNGPTLLKTVAARAILPAFDVSEEMYRKIRCPVLFIHGDNDQIQPYARAEAAHAEVSGSEFITIEGGGHNPLGRYPAKANTLINDFIDRRLGITAPARAPLPTQRRARSAPSIFRRRSASAMAVATSPSRASCESCHPDLRVDWLAQDPVTRLLEASNEHVHPLSARLASETRHIELESGEHELHCFQAIRRMDEVLIKNFMIFQDAVEQGGYDLVIADEAWDIDHYWHEHPELKKAKLAWLTDFVGYVPMPAGGEQEARLTADYNAEMIEHIEQHPGVRDRAIFVGTPEDIAPMSFGADLPLMRDWMPKAFRFRRLRHRRASPKLRQPGIAASTAGLPRRRADLHRHRRRLGHRCAPDTAHPPGLSDREGQASGAAHDRGRGPAHRCGVASLRLTASKCGRSSPISIGISRPAIVALGPGRAHDMHGACGRRNERSSIFRCEIILSRIFMSPTAFAAMARASKWISPHRRPEMIADAIALALSRPNNPKPVEADGPSKAAAMIAELL